MSFNLLVFVALSYVILLFLIAWAAESRAAAGWQHLLRSPFVYTLSLSIYCTAWTFYGAVGYAARSGLEFVTIYLGPTLVFIGWWALLRKLVRIGREQRVTSLADFLSSRFGKSNSVGFVVTLIAVLASTPYIALQLQSVTQSFGVFLQEGVARPASEGIAAWVAVGLAVFTILFGTRRLDAQERHHGIVLAIAVEALVKLVALVSVGVFVVWGLGGGIGTVLQRIDAESVLAVNPGRWAGLIFVSAAAVITLPRMFQVLVVENTDERHLAVASWAFPAYLLAMSLFILPIAVIGARHVPSGTNPDMLVLLLPLSEGRDGLALLAFLGGFSSATSMVIVETMALATMVSNHVAVPIWLRLSPTAARSEDLRDGVLNARRLGIILVLALGFGYYRLSGGSAALAAMGLIAFAGMAQVLPALVGGLFWRGATRRGAIGAMLVGGLVWAYCLFLPSFGAGAVLPGSVLTEGPWGISWLRPHALFGSEGLDPLLHALFWSLLFNVASFVALSLVTLAGPVERVQGLAFVAAPEREGLAGRRGWGDGQSDPEQVLSLAQRILGDEAITLFEAEARAQGKDGFLPDVTAQFLSKLERAFAGSVGTSTAHALIAQLLGGKAVTVEELMAVASESIQVVEYSARLEAQREELTRTARQLREANEKLTQLSVQKDAFLSQISHELRTPMTSIRAFSEILAEGGLTDPDVGRYGRIIHDEAKRLTGLLDDLLDISVLEQGKVRLNLQSIPLSALIDRALLAAGQIMPERVFQVRRDPDREAVFLRTDADRVVQVFINLISNARKYCDAAAPELRIRVLQKGGKVTVDFIDNGKGIAKAHQSLIFEKFARLDEAGQVGGAGLGLSICREVMANLGGSIAYLPGQGGAAFRVTLPLRRAETGQG